jgi:hypothetical protein
LHKILLESRVRITLPEPEFAIVTDFFQHSSSSNSRSGKASSSYATSSTTTEKEKRAKTTVDSYYPQWQHPTIMDCLLRIMVVGENMKVSDHRPNVNSRTIYRPIQRRRMHYTTSQSLTLVDGLEGPYDCVKV